MKSFGDCVLWFVTGSQHLYGEEVLKQVESNSRSIVHNMNESADIPIEIQFKAVLTGSTEIHRLIGELNNDEKCVGLICWMHTFSPAKMWISGLKALAKPMCHFHTQYNRDIPWSSIDMDFMNLNQSAHGGREFGFINSRMGIARKVVVGHWKDQECLRMVGQWSRVARAINELKKLKVARFGDNMREVAVTEGDKVEAQILFGFSVNAYGMGDLAKAVQDIGEKDITRLCDEYDEQYELVPALRKSGVAHSSLREAAKIELGLRQFLDSGGFKAFTDTFENLHGLKQLPGIAVQRLMADGYGFGAEGDWKTAALVRTLKRMGEGLPGGNSFMEDYTYHFDPGGMKVLGAHMLEICPSISKGPVRCEIHPLGIGGKEDPVRLVFDCPSGSALNASLIDLGNRFRLLVNSVRAIEPEEKLPRLPVARVLWEPLPSLKMAAQAWILAGGAHHSCFSQNVTPEMLEDFCEYLGIEFCLIDNNLNMAAFRNSLRWNELYYKLKN